MAEAQPLRAVFFDVGGTLVRPRLPMGEVVVRRARAAGVPLGPDDEMAIGRRLEALVTERPSRGEAFTYPPERSRGRWTRIYRASLDRVCPPHEAESIADEVWKELSSPAAYALYPDVRSTLRTLSNAGLLLGVVSNWEKWLPDLLERVGISPLFGCTIASGVVRSRSRMPRSSRRRSEPAGLNLMRLSMSVTASAMMLAEPSAQACTRSCSTAPTRAPGSPRPR